MSSDDDDVELARSRVGTLLRSKWRLDDLLGVGGMAAVYAATHKLGQRAAIKVLHPQIAVSKELRARFEQEALAVSKLGHPGTVQVFDVDETDDGAPFMVMELLDGESLGQRAYRLGTIPEEDLLSWIDGVLEVMQKAHDLGIVHRDIKPDNLFITKAGPVKVLDFGIARMRERGGGGVRTRTGAMLGTTPYMAPEQIHAKPVDGRVDLFAIGATMFRVLAKRRIHEAETDAELLMKMGSTPAPKINSVAPDVSARVALVIDRALAFNRDRRYPDAATMQADIRQVLAGEDPSFATQAALVTEEPTAPERKAPDAGAPAHTSERPPSSGTPGTQRPPSEPPRVETAGPVVSSARAQATRSPVLLLVLVAVSMLAVGAAAAYFTLRSDDAPVEKGSRDEPASGPSSERATQDPKPPATVAPSSDATSAQTAPAPESSAEPSASASEEPTAPKPKPTSTAPPPKPTASGSSTATTTATGPRPLKRPGGLKPPSRPSGTAPAPAPSN
jgi:eukaryotic-like serine/threonine-protein kinase